MPPLNNPSDEFATITEWLERDLGGRVVRIERQSPVAPAWWIDLRGIEGRIRRQWLRRRTAAIR